MTDEQVIAAVLSGDTEQFSILVQRYQHIVYSICYRYAQNPVDAQDLAQEVFLTTFRRLDSFREQAKFSTWLYRLGVNRCIDFTRKRQRERKWQGGEVQDYMADSAPGPEDEALRSDDARMLNQAIERLPDKYKSVLILYYTQELSYADISQALDIPVKTVETRLYRARKRLRDLLEDTALVKPQAVYAKGESIT